MNTRDHLRFKIYRVICLEGLVSFGDFSPDMVINEGKCEFYGEDAENLIFKTAVAINLPIEYFAEHFLFSDYFEP